VAPSGYRSGAKKVRRTTSGLLSKKARQGGRGESAAKRREIFRKMKACQRLLQGCAMLRRRGYLLVSLGDGHDHPEEISQGGKGKNCGRKRGEKAARRGGLQKCQDIGAKEKIATGDPGPSKKKVIDRKKNQPNSTLKLFRCRHDQLEQGARTRVYKCMAEGKAPK